MAKSLFDAALSADDHSLKALVDAGADLTAFDKHGFTALHRAAISADSVDDLSKVLVCLKYLIDAGSDIEQKSRDGRTALYLAAEFSQSIEPISLLLDAGASPDVTDAHGNHVVVNARTNETKELLSELSGYPIPVPPPPEPKSKRISAAQWSEIQPLLDRAFEQMAESGLVALQDAGTTQEDAFDECAEVFRERSHRRTPLGFCFYTRQDLQRAKRTGKLLLGIWVLHPMERPRRSWQRPTSQSSSSNRWGYPCGGVRTPQNAQWYCSPIKRHN